MPSFVNLGAYVGSGTMVDTYTVGSRAQIGRMSICRAVQVLAAFSSRFGYRDHRG